MLDPDNDLIPPSSPSISSGSSSDLDTESTGSFFHDRSTTLGTLMGLNFPAIPFRVSSRREDNNTTIINTVVGDVASVGTRKSKKKKVRRRVVVVESVDRRHRRWWKLCRDDVATPNSLREFLEVERRLSDGGGGGGEFYGVDGVVHHQVQVQTVEDGNRRVLFADGRVLPPAAAADVGPPVRRFPVLLSGICSGGADNGGA